ncbi:MAG: hypothetical protein K0R25_741 [Rickettsiaceae bacterium]|jgi:hypothetical protein|nr:hypothetical protein [Rickettsiaceae bacterium]
MKISLKEFLEKTDAKTNSGIFTFEKSPTILILNRSGVEAKSYGELNEIALSEEERDFTERSWQEIKALHPEFYNGYVTAVVDVVYDMAENSVSIIMDRARYSLVSALYKDGYPNNARAKEFLSFGLGLMNNITIAPDDSFLMAQRSQKVWLEKGAYSVPGGSMEYKEDEDKDGRIVKDDIRSGFAKSALKEVEEEILPESYLVDRGFVQEGRYSEFFDVGLSSLDWVRNPKNGKIGLNCSFQVIPKQPIDRLAIIQAFAEAKDQDENTGNFFFIDPSSGIDERGESNYYATPSDIIKETEENGKRKLEFSGTAALASQVVKRLKQDYDIGLYPGHHPSLEGFANKFTNLPGFSIFDLAKMSQNFVERPIPGAVVNLPQAESLQESKCNDKSRLNWKDFER